MPTFNANATRLAAQVAILALAACESQTDTTESSLLELTVGPATAYVEVADTSRQRRQGLMYREELPEDQGMLFVFDRPQRMSFYMRNTYIPLDIGYFDKNGVLREIHPLYPRDETPIRSRSDQLLYALEMNQGWFRKNGVKARDRLDLEALQRRLSR